MCGDCAGYSPQTAPCGRTGKKEHIRVHIGQRHDIFTARFVIGHPGNVARTDHGDVQFAVGRSSGLADGKTGRYISGTDLNGLCAQPENVRYSPLNCHQFILNRFKGVPTNFM